MIRKFDGYFIPVLEYLKQHGPTSGSKIRSDIQDITGVTEEERKMETSKGTNIANSRVYWAVQYLFQSGALNRPQRGIYEITKLGHELLEKYPDGFEESALKDTEGYKNWVARIGTNITNANESDSESGQAPQEIIDSTLTELEKNIGRELVTRLQNMDPEFLEKTVLKLLGAMGYGIDDDSLQHTGGPGDEGVDGIINQDRLGIQRIYVQAKRYKDGNDISREMLQAFVGASQGATGGIFITTSKFKTTAQEYADKNTSPKIITIDGAKLGELMVKHEVGAAVKKVYNMYEVDENFFTEE
jgi:restriction system protein